MLKNNFILLLFLGLFSCVSVEFTEPQPFWTENLNEIPSQLHGTYYSKENDTIEIGKNYYKVLNTNDNSILEKNPSRKIELSDSLIMRKIGRYIFLNEKEKENWSVSLITLNKEKSIKIGFITGSSEELNSKLSFISVQEIVTDESGKATKFILTPTKKELKRLIKKNAFEEALVLFPIKTTR
ncbi:MAG: hypothetical protein H6586_09075 [Flavobacteriales bacterium]|nr:hypothetical protein [Flavobacteriales bacterium]